jgi:hypothetical protein
MCHIAIGTNIVAKNWTPIATKHVLVVIVHIFRLNFTVLQYLLFIATSYVSVAVERITTTHCCCNKEQDVATIFHSQRRVFHVGHLGHGSRQLKDG